MFPLDSGYWSDYDKDGIPDEEDSDYDGNGVEDLLEDAINISILALFGLFTLAVILLKKK